MTLITKQKVKQLIYILKQENSRSLFLSCLPGDFKRTRTKLDLARLDDFQPGFSEQLIKGLFNSGAINYSPTDLDWDTTVDETDVTKKLSSLFDQGRTIEREKGSNPLKIGYPILIQENNSTTTNCFAAPLFIWDIDLAPGQNNWTIRASKDAPSKNHSLEGLIESEGTAIDLESLYSRFSEGQPLETFKEDFEDALNDFLSANPKVQTNFSAEKNIGLDRIPFTKKADLVTSEAQPYRISLINSALLGKFAEGKVSIIRDLETNTDGLEDLSAGGLKTSLLGANQLDPSQASIIPDIIRGEHVVLHGPPGTGKSQSITALITAAVSKNLRVAVVCQKMAALEVIESNLKELGIATGVAKITNPTKDRRNIIDEARRRKEVNRSCGGGHQQNLVKENTYIALTDSLNQSKEAAQSILIPPHFNFKDAVARLMKLERSIGDEHRYNLIQKSASSEQLANWTNDIENTLENTHLLQEQFEEVKASLHLDVLFNEKIATAQIGNDLSILESIMDRHAQNEKQRSQLLSEVSNLATMALETEANYERHVLSVRQKLDDSIHALSSVIIPGQLSFSKLFTPFYDVKELPIGEVLNEVTLCTEHVSGLNKKKFLLGQNPEHKKMLQASNFVRFLRKLINKNANKFWLEWSDFQHEISSFGFNISADFHGLNEQFKQTQHQLKTVLLSLDTTHSTADSFVPAQELTNCTQRREKLLRILENLEGPEQLEKATSTYKALERTQQEAVHLKDELESVNWLSNKGRKAILSSKGEQVIRDLRENSTKLPLVKRWKVASQNLLLNPDDFESIICKEWVEYQSIRSKVREWSDMEKLLFRDLKIRQIESEVQKVSSSVNSACKKTICKQFKKGVEGILRHPLVHSFEQEFAKTGRNRKSLRKLYGRHHHALTQLFPIHLTTPEVICNLFEGRDECFDLLIFDEASQVELQDSATCLLKGKSIVVAGDEHQMPPSQYFKTAVDHLYEEDDEDQNTGADIEVESLLEFCRQQQQFSSRFLDFHYRSLHPYLIQFSNHAIYSRLVIRPSSMDYQPIQLVDIQGTWENQHNLDEIIEVISILREFKVPDENVPKVMIATFNVRQRSEIIKAIDEAKQEVEFRKHIAPLEEAGLNVKNLENLQGDECDVLIISVGYGKTPKGTFSRSYSGINRKHGYRLLNVLITRSRHKVILLNSIPSKAHTQFENELSGEREGLSGRGLLHAYIQYAQAISNGDEARMRRILNILKENSLSQRGQTALAEEHFESLFESEVWNVLSSEYSEDEIQLQQPEMGFRIDMVVQPKSHPGLKIAVECDGEAFNSGWQNQLADFHREKLLRGAGYEFVRIWSRNWWMDTQNANTQLLREIDQIKQSWSTKETILPDWIADSVHFEPETGSSSHVELDASEDVLTTPSPNQNKNSRNPEEDTASAPTVDLSREFAELVLAPNHVLAPCLVTAELLKSDSENNEIRYLFLSNRVNQFKGHSKEEWQELARKSGKMAALGEESEAYRCFEGKEVDDIVSFRTNQFRITALEFDY